MRHLVSLFKIPTRQQQDMYRAGVSASIRLGDVEYDFPRFACLLHRLTMSPGSGVPLVVPLTLAVLSEDGVGKVLHKCS